jgi:NADPH2:quinone reductase
MKAIRITQNGDASVLQVQNLPQPKPGNGEALVRLKAAGLNFIDIYMRTGHYPRELPYTPGLEASGMRSLIATQIGKTRDLINTK